MLKMRSTFFVITAAFIFAALGFGLGTIAHFRMPVMVGEYAVPLALLWAASGAMFLMAFSSLRVQVR